jgi:hypothetical protein
MKAHRSLLSLVGLGLLAASLAACQPVAAPLAAAPNTDAPTTVATTVTLPTPTPEPSPTAAPTPEPTPTTAPTPLPGFPVGNELTVDALLERTIEGSPITIEQQLENGANYARYIASYISEGNKIYGLLTVPFGDAPEGGHKAIVFIHGYIPPDQYRTTERYVAYVDALAQAGFVVFKIDFARLWRIGRGADRRLLLARLQHRCDCGAQEFADARLCRPGRHRDVGTQYGGQRHAAGDADRAGDPGGCDLGGRRLQLRRLHPLFHR